MSLPSWEALTKSLMKKKIRQLKLQNHLKWPILSNLRKGFISVWSRRHTVRGTKYSLYLVNAHFGYLHYFIKHNSWFRVGSIYEYAFKKGYNCSSFMYFVLLIIDIMRNYNEGEKQTIVLSEYEKRWQTIRVRWSNLLLYVCPEIRGLFKVHPEDALLLCCCDAQQRTEYSYKELQKATKVGWLKTPINSVMNFKALKKSLYTRFF